jgi:hypothetical protein
VPRFVTPQLSKVSKSSDKNTHVRGKSKAWTLNRLLEIGARDQTLQTLRTVERSLRCADARKGEEGDRGCEWEGCTPPEPGSCNIISAGQGPEERCWCLKILG